MDVTVNEESRAGAPNPAGPPQRWWPGTTYSKTLVVACVDVAASTGLAAFKTAYAAPGAVGTTPRQYDAAGVRTTFVKELAADLATGGVALGFEAPL